LRQQLQLRFAPEITFAWDEQNGQNERLEMQLDALSKLVHQLDEVADSPLNCAL
jgi:hypothetical protein